MSKNPKITRYLTLNFPEILIQQDNFSIIISNNKIIVENLESDNSDFNCSRYISISIKKFLELIQEVRKACENK